MSGSLYFDPRFEQESIDEGLTERTQDIGLQVAWYFYDPASSTYGPVYDEGDYLDPRPNQGGLRWNGPHLLPVLSITRGEGQRFDQDSGFYTVDQIALYLPYRMAVTAGLWPPPDQTNAHLRDRFVFDNKVWGVTSMVARNLLGDGGAGSRAMIMVVGTEVTPDELVNAVDFAQWARQVDNS